MPHAAVHAGDPGVCQCNASSTGYEALLSSVLTEGVEDSVSLTNACPGGKVAVGGGFTAGGGTAQPSIVSAGPASGAVPPTGWQCLWSFPTPSEGTLLSCWTMCINP